MKTKVRGWNETQGIQITGIEDYKGSKIVDQRQVLKILESYITELYDPPNRPETLEVEPEEEADTGEKGPHILQSKVEKSIKEMRTRKATGDVLKLLGEDGSKILKKLSNAICNTGEWHLEFTEVTIIALKKKTSYKMQRLSHNRPYFK